jgi:hypothetical protein
MKDWIINRLKEPSTWRGIFAMLAAAGIAISPDLQGHITTAGLALIGLINFIKKDAASPDA